MSQIFHTINIIFVSVRTLDYSLWSHHHTCYSQYFKILGIKFTPPFQLYFTYVFVSYTSCYVAKDSWEIRGIWLLQYCKENNDWVTSYMVSWSALSFFLYVNIFLSFCESSQWNGVLFSEFDSDFQKGRKAREFCVCRCQKWDCGNSSTTHLNFIIFNSHF